MAGKTVIVGCKLPHGIVLENPLDPSVKRLIKGKNSSLIVGAPHCTTEVDADFWAAWLGANADFPAVKSGAIFEAKSEADAAAIVKETLAEKTGFEPMPQQAPGIEKADEK